MNAIRISSNKSEGNKAKEVGDHPDCFQHNVRKPAFAMVWGYVSAHGRDNLHICEGTVNAERHIQVLTRCHSSVIFFRDDPAYFSKTMQSHILHVTTA